MFRSFAIIAVLASCLATAGWAQSPAAAPATTAKPAAKKQAPGKNAARAPASAETGPCQIGVISAIGEQFSVLHIGLTVLGNEYVKAPIDTWGIDDVVVTRVRAAASGATVRKIAYARGAFELYYNPEVRLFRNDRDDLTALVRQIAGNANCERYVVATKVNVALDGTNQTIAGVGVYKNWTSPSGRGVVVAYFRLTVFDGRTFDIHRAPSRNFGDAIASAFAGKGDDIRILNDLEFPKTPEQAANNALLRDNARNLVAAKLDKVLPPYLAQ